MPPRDLPFGSDTLTVPCYLSTGPDDPGLAAWKSEHPDWFEAGTWTRVPRPRASHATTNDAKSGVAPIIAAATVAGRGPASWRPAADAEAAEAALRAAAFPNGLPALDDHDWFRGQSGHASAADAGSDGGFALYPPASARDSAGVERVNDKVDPITTRARDVEAQLRILIDTEFRNRVATIDRAGSPAAFGSRLHRVLAEVIRDAHIPRVRVEQSFIDGGPASYSQEGSTRTDILLELDGKIVHVWDFKTGTTPKLPEARRQEIRDAIRSQYKDTNIPVDVLYEGFHWRWPWQ